MHPSPTDELPPVAPRGPSTPLQVDLDLDPRIHFALQQNDVRIVKEIRLTNPGNTDLEDLTIEVSLGADLARPWVARLDRLRGGRTHHLGDVQLRLDPEVLRGQTERESAVLGVTVWSGPDRSAPVGSTERPVEVFALREWTGLRSLPEMLAAFVLPNDPAIDGLLARIGARLQQRSGNGAVDGYQSRDPGRVREIVAAAFDTLRECGIGYVNPPASFEQDGQKVRLPGDVLGNRIGTCLDLSLLAAAVLEQCGLRPVVVIVEGHAFVAVWTVAESFQTAAVEDGLQLRKRVQLGDLLVFETTLLTQADAQFADSVRAAEHRLDDLETFRCAIDVQRARSLRIRPLPVRDGAGGWRTTVVGLPIIGDRHGEPGDGDRVGDDDADRTVDASEAADADGPGAEDDSAASADDEGRLGRWRRRLLDLTLRNRLINFRDGKRVLQLLAPDVAALEDALADGKAFVIRSDREVVAPLREPDPERMRVPLDADGVDRLLGEELRAGRLVAPYTDDELDRRLLEVWRQAKTAREESGANNLVLAIGMLVWFESPSSSIERRAPILLLPLEIERPSARDGFRIRLDDDEPQLNQTLLEKLAADGTVDVSTLGVLDADESGIDVAGILDRFRRAILHIDRWEVRAEAWIAQVSFTKFLMWLDLQRFAGTLHAHPVLASILDRELALPDADRTLPEPDQLDTQRKIADTLCPLDADSSQLAAVFAAADGRSFVLEGPPGTGKSQTIANLIGQCLGQGKSVLFVSEKMAALEVVHRRLQQVGLGPFCLELHSSKAHKREVVEQIWEAYEVGEQQQPADWQRVVDRLEAARTGLNQLVAAVHRPRGFGESVFQATSRSIGLAAAPVIGLPIDDVASIDGDWIDNRRQAIDRLQSALRETGEPSGHPFRAVRRANWETTLPDRVHAAITASTSSLRSFDAAFDAALAALRIDTSPRSRPGGEAFVAIAGLLADDPAATRKALTEPGQVEVAARMRALVAAGRARDAARTEVFAVFAPTILEADLDALLARWQRAGRSMWPFSSLRRRGVRNELREQVPAGKLPADGELATVLERAIDLRTRTEVVVASGAEALGWFVASRWNEGEAVWSDLDRHIDTVVALRDALRSLRETEPNSQPLRDRLLALATDARDDLAGRVGDAMRELAVAHQQFVDARARLDVLLDVDVELAWTPVDATPWRAHVANLLTTWEQRHRQMLNEWCYWRAARREAEELGLQPLIAAIERGELTRDQLAPAFERAFRAAWLAATIDGDAVLAKFQSREHERRILAFRDLDQTSIELARDVLRSRLGAKVPRAYGAVSESSEVGILQRERRKKRRHLPVRRLIERMPNLLPLLKPCFLMSPLSVAQYLAVDGHPEQADGSARRALQFDVVVFDEASQITPWDAVGAIARGRSCVVVGDTRQLPPTAFFQRVEDDETELDETDLEDLESILDECAASGMPSARLRWHYRSRHESLIAFSNYHYYDNRLLTFPAPAEVSDRFGVSCVRVPDGVYDRSKTRTNRAEADSVVADLLRRLRAHGTPQSMPSVGIVTFSMAQQTLIEDLIDAARRDDPALEPFFTDAVTEPVFIKNLENVQGDERDVILFSICYGPDANGRVAMNFGPLNTPGGERRLNVAVTRARQQVVVHATLRADQIDLSRTAAVGVHHLKQFLDYAVRGPAAIAEAIELDAAAQFDSPFERQVHDALTARGHDVALQVGCSGYRIDLAIRDPDLPGRFLLGIECDGAFYHSAKTARDRDRLREGVLRRLGWELIRVWSTDWWRSPDREVERIEVELQRARRERSLAIEPVVVDGPSPSTSVEASDEVSDEAKPAPTRIAEFHPPAAPTVPQPDPASEPNTPPGSSIHRELGVDALRGDRDALLERAATRAITDLVAAVLATEGPIHEDELCRRVAAFWSIDRVTARVRQRILEVARVAPAATRGLERAGFWWPRTIDPEVWRGYRVPADGTEPTRSIEQIPVEEVANAVVAVLRSQIALPESELARQAARLLGYARLGAKLQTAMVAGMRLAVRRGSAEANGESVRLK